MDKGGSRLEKFCVAALKEICRRQAQEFTEAWTALEAERQAEDKVLTAIMHREDRMIADALCLEQGENKEKVKEHGAPTIVDNE